MVDPAGNLCFTAGMNPTKAEAMKALGIQTNAEFARFLDLPRQSMTGRGDDDELPDAWCWRAMQKRPDIFGPAPTAAQPGEGERSGEKKRAA